MDMLPFQRDKIAMQLIRWGYSARIVEQMKPWGLLSHFEMQKRKREYLDANDPYANYENVYRVDKIEADKYQGIKIPVIYNQ